MSEVWKFAYGMDLSSGTRCCEDCECEDCGCHPLDYCCNNPLDPCCTNPTTCPNPPPPPPPPPSVTYVKPPSTTYNPPKRYACYQGTCIQHPYGQYTNFYCDGACDPDPDPTWMCGVGNTTCYICSDQNGVQGSCIPVDNDSLVALKNNISPRPLPFKVFDSPNCNNECITNDYDCILFGDQEFCIRVGEDKGRYNEPTCGDNCKGILYEFTIRWFGGGFKDLDTAFVWEQGVTRTLGYGCNAAQNDNAVLWLTGDNTSSAGNERYFVKEPINTKARLYVGWFEPANQEITGSSLVELTIRKGREVILVENFDISVKIIGCASNQGGQLIWEGVLA